MVSRTIEVPSGGSSSPLRASHNVPESPGTSSRQAHEEREHAEHLNAPLNAKQATDSATLARSDGTPKRRKTRPTPPATKLTRRQRIAHAALVELQREAAALERRIQRELVEAYAGRELARIRGQRDALRAFNGGGR